MPCWDDCCDESPQIDLSIKQMADDRRDRKVLLDTFFFFLGGGGGGTIPYLYMHSWSTNPLTVPPPRNKGLKAGLINGNQWLLGGVG